MADLSDTPPQEPVLDVTAEQIARTYAEGFLGAAGDDPTAAVEDLEAVRAEVLGAFPQFAAALRSAFLDHDARVAMIDRVVGGRVAPSVLNLLKVLSAHGRMELVGEVVRQARKLFDQKCGREDVLVRLAHSADPALLSEIEQTVRAKTGIEPIIRVEIDPELVGGLEIRVGDTVFDGSVRTAFKKAHKQIVDQTVEAIESRPERFTLAE
ncbi:ATP synthase subunit delta [Planctomycetes bacterium MalM25]|nr:ATP synthase subunit delta [Planctomycetes bacterium MalM25]